MKKALFIFGTRPEAIKLAPIIKLINQHDSLIYSKVIITAQHREMLDQVLNLFGIQPEYDLNVMIKNQSLSSLTAKILLELSDIIKSERPDLVIVQGDTTSTFCGALSAFYQNVPIAHIEAGLRTGNIKSPFPEEVNRRITSIITNFHFAPTKEAEINLIREGISNSNIFITGNTVIDALLLTVKKHQDIRIASSWLNYFYENYNINLAENIKRVLVTGHRRESFGEGFQNICNALYTLAQRYPELQIIYPVHLNPNVQQPVYNKLENTKNIHLINPLEYEPFVFLMNKCDLILTDSGGVQEEAPSLGKPVLVMRENTERPEGIEVGTAKLVGTDEQRIILETESLLFNSELYNQMSQIVNPYGDGQASEKIKSILEENI